MQKIIISQFSHIEALIQQACSLDDITDGANQVNNFLTYSVFPDWAQTINNNVFLVLSVLVKEQITRTASYCCIIRE